MVQAGHRTGFWQSVRQLPGRIPLWGKLITALLALVAIALVVISVAGIGFLRSYLVGQENQDLTAAASSGRLQNTAEEYLYAEFAGAHPGQPTAVGVSVDWLSGGKLYPAILPTATTGYGPTIAGPSYSSSAPWIQSGAPATVGSAGGGDWRVVATPFALTVNGGGQVNGTLIVGIDVTSDYQTLGKLAGIDWIVSGLLLIVLAIVGVAVIRASLRPLTDIEQTAGAIAAGDLARRVPERDPRTEVGRLGRSLNVMLSQIESAFRSRSRSEAAARRSEERMRQFVADASHELRTPLTAIRGFAEYYRQRGGIVTGGNGSGQLDPASLDRIMRRVEQEAARMGVLVEDMLLLARLDQQRPLERRPVDLLSLAADAVHDARVGAPDRSINLTVGTGAALLVIGDEVRLRQVIGNLMSNALAHTPDGTPIDVLIRSGSLDEAPTAAPPPPEDADLQDGQQPDEWATPAPPEPPSPAAQPGPRSAVVLEVADQGPGLTKEQAEHVFERFYRGDQARSSGGGAGLGLAIVAALVAAHGGATWVRSRPGAGATFCIALPLAPEAMQGAEAEDEPDGTSDDRPEPKDDPSAWLGSDPAGRPTR
jgi:two-component system, OmpR family, sensor kinase